MRELVLASANPHKLRELGELLEPLGFTLSDMRSRGFTARIIEDGETFEENAARKAETVSAALGVPAVADDSGLVVPALGGLPGVRSARFAGEGASDEDHWRLLLEMMRGLRGEERKAYFVCVIALARPGRASRFFRAERWGLITEEPRGRGGFGYDPVFFDPELGATYAEDPRGKQRVSHRARALRLLIDHLRDGGK